MIRIDDMQMTGTQGSDVRGGGDAVKRINDFFGGEVVKKRRVEISGLAGFARLLGGISSKGEEIDAAVSEGERSNEAFGPGSSVPLPL